jgi:hypothetical protein
MIGEYEMVDEAHEAAIDNEAPAQVAVEPERSLQPLAQGPLVFGAGNGSLGKRPKEAIEDDDAGKANGIVRTAPARQRPQDGVDDDKTSQPPVPRPRLLFVPPAR